MPINPLTYQSNGQTVFPVHKPDKPFHYKNCRPITITPLPFRILSSVVAQRVQSCFPAKEDQFGFINGRCIHSVFLLNSVCETIVTSGNYVFQAFINFSSAFDTKSYGKQWGDNAPHPLWTLFSRPTPKLETLVNGMVKFLNFIHWKKMSGRVILVRGHFSTSTSTVLVNIWPMAE